MADETSEVSGEESARSTGESAADVVNEPRVIEAKGILSYPLARVSPSIMEEIRNVRMRLAAAKADFPIMEPATSENDSEGVKEWNSAVPFEVVEMERVIDALDKGMRAATVGEMMARLEHFFGWVEGSATWAAQSTGAAGLAWEKDHLGDGVLTSLKGRPWVRFFQMNPQAWDERIAKILFGTSLVADGVSEEL